MSSLLRFKSVDSFFAIDWVAKQRVDAYGSVFDTYDPIVNEKVVSVPFVGGVTFPKSVGKSIQASRMVIDSGGSLDYALINPIADERYPEKAAVDDWLTISKPFFRAYLPISGYAVQDLVLVKLRFELRPVFLAAHSLVPNRDAGYGVLTVRGGLVTSESDWTVYKIEKQEMYGLQQVITVRVTGDFSVEFKMDFLDSINYRTSPYWKDVKFLNKLTVMTSGSIQVYGMTLENQRAESDTGFVIV